MKGIFNSKLVLENSKVVDSVRVYDDRFRAREIAKEVSEGIESLVNANTAREELTNLLISLNKSSDFQDACENINTTVAYCSGLLKIDRKEILGENFGLESVRNNQELYNSAVEGIGEFISKLIEKIKDFFKWLWNKVKQFFRFITGRDSKEEIFSYSRALSDMSKGLIEAAKNTSMSIFSLSCDSIDKVLNTIVSSDPSKQSIGMKIN